MAVPGARYGIPKYSHSPRQVASAMAPRWLWNHWASAAVSFYEEHVFHDNAAGARSSYHTLLSDSRMGWS